MKKPILFILIIIFCLSLNYVIACQDMPIGYYEYLSLEETVDYSNYIVIAEKIRDGPSVGEFPSGEAIGWMEIRVKEGISIDPPYAYSKMKIRAPLPCGYVGGYPYLEKNRDYLIFIGEKNQGDIFASVRDASNTSRVFYGKTAYMIEDNQIIGMNMSLDVFKNVYFNITNCAKEGESISTFPFENEYCCEGLVQISEEDGPEDVAVCKNPEDVVDKQNVWQKILSWFKNLFS